MPYKNLGKFLDALKKAGDLHVVRRARRSRVRGRRDRAARRARGQAGAALHQRQGLGAAARDERARHAAPHRARARPRARGGRRGAGRVRRAHEAAVARRAVGLARDGRTRAERARRAARRGRLAAGARAGRPPSPAGAALLAGRRRPLLHLADDADERSRHARTQPRPLSPARPRLRDHRHALADPEGRRLPSSRGREARRAAAGHGVARRRSLPHALGRRAAARGHRRARVRRVPARRAHADRAGRDGRRRVGPRRGRDRARRLRAAARAPHGRPVRRPLRPLLARRAVPGVQGAGDHAPQERGRLRRRSSASRRRRTRRSAKAWAR